MSMKRMKVLLVLAMSLSLVFGSILTANAADEQITEIGLGIDDAEQKIEPQIGPKYISSCPNGSYHLMRGKGTGWVYYGAYPSKDLRFTGQAGQCENCKLVVITETNQFLYPSLPWGKYATWNTGYEVGIGVKMYTKSIGTINKVNDPFALGFKWK